MLNNVLANAIAQNPEATKVVVDHNGLGFHLTKIDGDQFSHRGTEWTHTVAVYDHGYWHTGYMYPSQAFAQAFAHSESVVFAPDI